MGTELQSPKNSRHETAQKVWTFLVFLTFISAALLHTLTDRSARAVETLSSTPSESRELSSIRSAHLTGERRYR